MVTKKIFLIITAFLLCISMLPLGTLALGRVINENYDYIRYDSTVIGWDQLPVTVGSDTVITVLGGGAEPLSVTCFEGVRGAYFLEGDSHLPVSRQTFSLDGLDISLELFASEGVSEGDVYLYAGLECVNSGDGDAEFPALSEPFVPISETSGAVEAGKKAFCAYAFLINSASEEGAELPLAFDEAREKMEAHWALALEDELKITGFRESSLEVYQSYLSTLVLDRIGTACTSLTPCAFPEGTLPVLAEGGDYYRAALAVRRSRGELFSEELLEGAAKKADSIFNAMSEVDFYPGARLLVREDGAHLFDNLDALSQLLGCAYILGTANDSSEEHTAAYERTVMDAEKLAADIYACLNHSAAGLAYDFEACDLFGDDGMILVGDGFESAAALCEWYIKNSAFTFSVGEELSRLAVNSLDYYDHYRTCEAMIGSYICERGDNTVLIGRGTAVELLADGAEFSVENYRLSSGSTVSYKVSVDKKNVKVELFCEEDVAVQLEFSAFRNNIESASCGYDIESGIVTAPEGTTVINVRLVSEAGEIEKKRHSDAELERALALASSVSTEGCTGVSGEEFQNALKEAEKARGSEYEIVTEVTERLNKAMTALSPMVAGYTSETLAKDARDLGTLTYSEIYQKITLPKDGKVKSIFVRGEYSEGISCAVYTLRGDAYTTDELLWEDYGKSCEGGILFDVEFEAKKDEVYVLCIFQESGEVSLSLYESYEENAYTQSAGETTLYSGVGLYALISVDQVDRSSLDTYYGKCLEKDVSPYTKSSRREFEKKLNSAKSILCTPSVSEEEYNEAYKALKASYNGLETYASDDVVEEFPTSSIILICIVAVLLVGTFASAMISARKGDKQ